MCATQCTCKSEGQVCSTLISGSPTDRNFMIECSTTKCGADDEGNTIYLNHGWLKLTMTNSSGNKGEYGVAYTLVYPATICIISYVTIQGNNAKCRTISHYVAGSFQFSKSNYCNNTVYDNGTDYCHVYSNADSLEVENCCFFENIGTVLFLKRYNGNFIVNNCYIDQYSTGGYRIVNRTLFNSSALEDIIFLISQHINATQDSIIFL